MDANIDWESSGAMAPVIGILGLGYVGLPLAVLFAQKYRVIGFDLSQNRIEQLRNGVDRTREITAQELEDVADLTFSSNAEDLEVCNVYIVAVPTPIDRHKRPDLTPLLKASNTVGKVLSKGDIVIFESTVYPGATEEDCVPVLEETSHLKFNKDFFAGYSPERVNPGDKQHRITDIVKVTSGSTAEVAVRVNALYASVVEAGTHQASSIRVAEAAKVIENTQRDVNIALVNELAILFQRMGIDTTEVLEAAGTKWNFLPFRPGLVGGHCIGVDPYYLTHKAQGYGVHPEMILAGRRTNDAMGEYIAGQVVKLLAKNGKPVVGSRILILGATFKENCPDLRNSQVLNLARALAIYNVEMDIHDPWAQADDVESELGIKPIENPATQTYDLVVLAVAHSQYLANDSETIRQLADNGALVYDVKSALPRGIVSQRL